MSDLMFDFVHAAELKAAFRRDPRWTNALIAKLCERGKEGERDVLSQFADVLLGLAEVRPAKVRPLDPIPADDVEFELTLKPIDALEMVRADGIDPKGWRYKGLNVTNPETKRVKLIRLGYVRNLAEAQSKARERGCKLVSGQWREAFKERFRRNDGRGSIAFGGEESVWVDSIGQARHPVLKGNCGGWSKDFCRSRYTRSFS